MAFEGVVGEGDGWMLANRVRPTCGSGYYWGEKQREQSEEEEEQLERT